MLIRFKAFAYLEPGAVVKLDAEQAELRRLQVRPAGGRGGWFKVHTRTGFTAGMEAQVRELPTELIAGGLAEELPERVAAN